MESRWRIKSNAGVLWFLKERIGDANNDDDDDDNNDDDEL